MKNRKGFSLVETLVALGIGAVIAGAIAGYVAYLSKMHQTMILQKSTSQAIHAFAENIRFNLSLYQISFDNSVPREEALLAADKLPLAISENNVIPRSECSRKPCRAYLGYIIIPSEFVRNLYQVKFMVANVGSKEVVWQKDYSYYITVK